MPELPEVQVVINFLKTKVLNKTISNVKILSNKFIKNVDPSEFARIITNNQITNISRIGKYLIFNLSNNFSFVVHLRMEGKFFVDNIIRTHDYIIFIFEDNQKLSYNDTRQFGTFHLVKTNELFDLSEIKKIAYDPLDDRINFDQIFNKINKSSKPIKTILLDQTIISGIGNIYANEILFASKINPFTIGKLLTKDDVKKILINAKMILEKSILHGGTSIHSFSFGNNQKGNYAKFLNVHFRDKQKCYTCNNAIVCDKLNSRSAYYCKQCQPFKQT